MTPTGDDQNGNEQQRWFQLAGLGMEFIGAVVLFGAVGWWIDRRMSSSPWGLIIGGAIGFAGGLYALVKAGSKSFKD